MEFLSTNTNYLNIQERQLHANEDYVISGKNLVCLNGKKCDWICLLDGHGGSDCINIIKKLVFENKLIQFISQYDPIEPLIAYMKLQPIYDESGATCIIVKIFEDGIIQSWSVGDSRVAIFINSEMVYINCPHNMKNPLEKGRLASRLQNKTVSILKSHLIPIISTKLIMKARPSEYIIFKDKFLREKILAMSQTLGDTWITGIFPEKIELQTNLIEDTIRVVVGSDGFWDHYIHFQPQPLEKVEPNFKKPLDQPLEKVEPNFKNHLEKVEPNKLLEDTIKDAEEDLKDITTMSSKFLIEKMEARWKQDWIYFWSPLHPTISEDVSYEGNYDDISLAIWSNKHPKV